MNGTIEDEEVFPEKGPRGTILGTKLDVTFGMFCRGETNVGTANTPAIKEVKVAMTAVSTIIFFNL